MSDKTYPLSDNPEYKTNIKKLEDTDKASAELTFNPLFQDVLENIHAVKMDHDYHKEGKEHDGRYYTQEEVDNKFSALETNIDWKESVNTFADIVKFYPDPEDGWTVNVKDTNYTYRWTGTEWAAISANSIPIATKDEDGKMSKEQAAKLEGVAANANNYTHPNSGAIAGTYKSVTVNGQGHVTKGTNPTTLAGYGITDAALGSDLTTHTKNDDIHMTKAEKFELAASLQTQLDNKINIVITDYNIPISERENKTFYFHVTDK